MTTNDPDMATTYGHPEEKSTMPRTLLTVRTVVTAIVITLLVTAGSSYVALKLGILPWPIVFSVMLAAGIMKFTGPNPTLHAINLAQAGGSVGGLVAAGVCFSIPGILFLNQTHGLTIPWPTPLQLTVITICAGLHGVLLSVPLKHLFIDEEQLPYPSGVVGAEFLKAGKKDESSFRSLLAVGSFTALVTSVRDIVFPAGFPFFFPSPLAIGIGFLLGVRASIWWFAGALVGNCWSTRISIKSVGMGIVLGAGLGFLVSYVLPRSRDIIRSLGRMGITRFIPLVSLVTFPLLVISGIPWLAALLAILGTWLMVAVAGRMTGETNIDPLEQFGIFIGLVVALVFAACQLPITPAALFFVVAFVSIACAVAGDIGHDYKSAHLLGTPWMDIVRIDLIAVIAAAIAAPWALEIMKCSFGEIFFTPAMPAPQSQMVAGSIVGFQEPALFVAGLAIGLVAEIVNAFRPRVRLVMMPFGIGLFLGLGLAIPLMVGGLLAWFLSSRPARARVGVLMATAVIGGESVAGFTAGCLTVFGLTLNASNTLVMTIAGGMALMTIYRLRRWRKT